MNFDFSDEQKQFGEQAKRLLAAVAPLAQTRKALEGQAPFCGDAWRGLADIGFQAITIPEQYGGLGMSPLELCVAAEQIGGALAPIPSLSSTYICSEAIRLFGSDAQRRSWLPRLANATAIGTWAVAERGVETTPSAIKCNVRQGALFGRKAPVLDGAVADVAIVLAIGPDLSPALTLCDLSSPHVIRTPLENVDPSRPVAELRFEGAPIEPLGDAGWSAWTHILNRAAILLAFEQVGAADRALWMARDYALSRRSFGRLIGSYQAIKHKLANVYAKTQIARSHAYYGAWALTTGAAELPLAAAGAHVAACEAFTFAAQENLQTHGGVGFTWDSDCHLFYRRARHQALILGSVSAWKHRTLEGLMQLARQQP